jgi:hypothetical protein
MNRRGETQNWKGKILKRRICHSRNSVPLPLVCDARWRASNSPRDEEKLTYLDGQVGGPNWKRGGKSEGKGEEGYVAIGSSVPLRLVRDARRWFDRRDQRGATC